MNTTTNINQLEFKHGDRVYRKDLVGTSGEINGSVLGYGSGIPIASVKWDDGSRSRILVNQLLPGEKKDHQWGEKE